MGFSIWRQFDFINVFKFSNNLRYHHRNIYQNSTKIFQKIAKTINNNVYKDQEAGIINNYDINIDFSDE